MARARRAIDKRFWEKVDTSADCWLWTASKNKLGYGWFRLPDRKELAHRVAYELANGPIPAGLCVCHRCDNPSCVRADHLFLGDQSDNMKDAQEKRRMASGDRHGMRRHPERLKRGLAHWNGRLTPEHIASIHAGHASGERNSAIARRLTISPSTVCQILNGQRHRSPNPALAQ